MTFFAPIFLWAIGAIAIPIAIHIFSKTKLKRVRWAATRFINIALQRNSRKLQVEDLLLLLLRCLFVAALALAFARPALIDKALNLGSGGSATVVLVVDQTASMGQNIGSDTRFAQAQTAGKEILSQLPEGSAAALFFASDRTFEAVPKPVTDLKLVERTLAKTHVSARGGDLFSAVQAAADLLSPVPGRRDIFILTDNQSATWSQADAIRALRDKLGASITLHLVTFSGSPEANLAVTGLSLGQSIPAVGQPARCEIEVKNFSTTTATNVHLTLAVDQNAPVDETLIPSIAPGATATVDLFASFHDAGYHTLTATLPPDALAVDNQRSVAVLAVNQLHALVVEGTPPASATHRDGYFLVNALAPVSPADAPKYYLQPTLADPTSLSATTLGNTDLVVLANVPRLTAAESTALHAYVEAGGALIVFPGPATDVDFYNDDPDFSSLLPARLSLAKDSPTSAGLNLASQGYTHPVTELWNDHAMGNLSGIYLTRYFPFTPVNAAVARTGSLLHFANNQPAALTWDVGHGHVALFDTTATSQWTNLPVNASFIPLLYRLVAFLTRHGSDNLALSPGQPFNYTVSSDLAGQDFSVTRPGDGASHRIAGQIKAGGTTASLSYADTETPGGYQLFTGTSPQALISFAVQVPASESDLTTITGNPLIASSTSTGSAAAAASQVTTFNPEITRPLELWPWFIAGAFLIALLETALAHRFSQAK